MSDVNVTEAAPDLGQAAEVEQPEAYEAEGERAYLNTDDYSDFYVKVKVDGAEHEVPLSEALNGYSRQEHFTRLTQAHAEDLKYAEWAKNFEQALVAGDWGVLDRIAASFGRDGEASQPDPQAAEPEPTLTPEQAQVAKLQYDLDTVLLEKHIGELSTQYPDFDPLEVVQAMADAGYSRPDKAAMEAFYKRISADKLYQQHLATQAAAAVQEQQNAAITDQKRQDGIVSSGARAAAPTAQVPTQGRSVEEALELAINEANDGAWHW